jgi:dolichyl-phosphate-mannose-protein mannosyltransferase
MNDRQAIAGKEWKQVIALAVGLKLVSLIVFCYGWIFLPQPDYKTDIWMTRPQTTFKQNLANFDGAWFVRVAAIGYEKLASGEYSLEEQTKNLAVMDQLGYEDGKKLFGYRHWPLLPWLMRVLAPVTGGHLNAGLIIVNGLYFLICIMLYKLCRFEYNHKTGLIAVALISLHPGAWALTALFNEAPFIAFAAASMVCMRERKFLSAGIWGMLMAATRPGGIVIMIPLLYEYLAIDNEDPRAPLLEVMNVSNIKDKFIYLFRNPITLSLVLIPMGTFIAMGHYYQLTGNPFAFTLAHEASAHGHVSPPWEVLYHTFLRGREFQLKESVFHLVTLVVLLFSLKSGRRSYLIWMVLFTFFHSIHNAHSFVRY